MDEVCSLFLNIINKPVVSIIIGSVITWFFSYIYYKKSGDKLREEAEKLERLNILILRAMENAGLAKLNKDENGNPTGLIIELSHIEEVCLGESSDLNLTVPKTDNT